MRHSNVLKSAHIDLTNALRLPVIALVFGFSFLHNLRADWSWKSDETAASLRAGQFVAKFVFHNNGKKPVTVTDLPFSCACTAYSFKVEPARGGGDGSVSVFLSADIKADTLLLVAFGSDETKPTPLTIHISRPERALPTTLRPR